MSNGLILDLILAALLLIGFLIGYKRGIFKAVIGLVVTAASLFGAFVLSEPIAVPVTNFIFPYIKDSLGGLLENASRLNFAAEGLSGSISQLLSKINFSGLNLSSLNLEGLDLSNIDLSSINISSMAAQSTVTDIDVAAASMKLLQPIVRTICGIIIFILLSILLRLITNLLNKLVTSIPIVKGANAVLGGVFGLAEVVVLILIATYIAGIIGIPAKWASYTESSFLFGVLENAVPKLFAVPANLPSMKKS